MENLFYQNIMKLFCHDLSGQHGSIEAFDTNEIPKVIEYAEKAGLHTSLYSIVKEERKTDLLPAPQRARLEHTHFLNIRDNLKHIFCLKKIHNLFEKHGIEYCLLKEYALNPEDNPDLGKVYQCDVDILISDKDKERALALMKENNFQLKRIANEEMSLFCRDSFVSIDLHTILTNIPQWYMVIGEDLEGIISRRRFITIEDTRIPVLGLVDSIIYLLGHISIHHNFIPFSKVVNTWNYFRRHLTQEVMEEVSLRFFKDKTETLGWFTFTYLEEIVGYETDRRDYFKKPSQGIIEKLRSVYLPADAYFTKEYQKALYSSLYKAHLRYFMDSVIDRLKHDLACIKISHFNSSNPGVVNFS